MRISNDITTQHQTNMKLQQAQNLSAKDMSKLRDKELKEVSKEFASLFINELYKSMRKTLDNKNSMLDGGEHKEMFEDMLYTEYSRMTAEQGTTGLGKMVYDFLKRS